MAQIDTKWFGDEVKKRAESLKSKSTVTIGMVVMSDAKQLCAVNYGYLAASIQTAGNDSVTRLESPGAYAKESPPAGHKVGTFRDIAKPSSPGQVFVGTAVDYGPYVEYGTVKSNAQPFLRPALDMARGKVPQIVTIEGRKEFGEYLK
jgi:HK97 gp10 family phage protein